MTVHEPRQRADRRERFGDVAMIIIAVALLAAAGMVFMLALVAK